MAVIDELIVRKGTTRYPIDSYDNKMIDEIVYEGQSFHFAKQKDLTGTSEIVADNGVAEPIISLEVSGNTSQKQYQGYNLLNKEEFTNSALRNETQLSIHGSIVMSAEKVNTMLKPNTKYRMSFEVEGVSGIKDGGTIQVGQGFLFVVGATSNWLWIRSNKIANEGEVYNAWATFTTPADFYEKNYQLYVYTGTYLYENVTYRATCIIRNVQIVEGTEAKPYEPYVGGIPSPNPQYPQEIENANADTIVLPSEYQQVEYIESTGTQYIDTGVLTSENNSFEVKAQLVHTNTASQTIWGGRESATVGEMQSNQLSCVKSTGKYQFVCGNNSTDGIVFDTQPHILKAEKNVLYVDNNLVSTVPSGEITNQNNIYLFATNTNGTVGFNGGDLKIYYCKIWNDDTLVRDYIPCYRIADNLIGMYDLVTKVFYTNQGTGKFLKGANKEGMSVTLHGDNLFNKNNIDKTRHLSNGSASFSFNNISTYNCAIIPCCPNTTYIKSGDFGASVSAFLDSNESFLAPASMIANGTPFTTPSDCKYMVFNVLVTNAPYENCQVEKGSMVTAYNPYFNEEIAIPTSVEVEGETVDLRFAKQGNKADKLIVDKISGKVTYEQWVKTTNFPLASAGWNTTTTANQVRTIRLSLNMPNYLSNLDYSQGYLLNKFKKVSVATLDEESFFQSSGWLAIRIDRNSLETQDGAGFYNWFKTQQDNGDPVLINYALANPITHDITNTDLGQSLLALATGKGTNYLEITSNLEPSQTEFSYWRQIIPNE